MQGPTVSDSAQVAADDGIWGYPGRPLIHAEPEFELAVTAVSVPMIRSYLNGFDEVKRPGVIRSYLEKHYDSLTVNRFRALLAVEPRLICDNIAELLVFNCKEEVMQLFLERGWRASPAFVETVNQMVEESLGDAEEDKAEQDEAAMKEVRALLAKLQQN